ncbi:hypothetical protein [Arthrobacter roseus]|nr:hypothetical protein [Arthrobacter roseus]MBM7848253.1 hypothetical protein [Arthrobacter roseus]
MALAGLLIGGAISFRRQNFSTFLTVALWILAGLSLLAAYLLTL